MSIYKRKRLIERIVLIGPIDQQVEWICWCYEEGYSVLRTGPKPTSRHRLDMKKFKIIAEKEVCTK